MVDNENVLTEFDYQNIILIDPNKTIDAEGKVKERLVKHENLVMYANLECSVLPRTKLAVGAALNDSKAVLQSIASINFLKPGGKTFLDNTYTDEITGKDSLKGKAINQPSIEYGTNPKVPDGKSGEFFYMQNTLSNGESNTMDTGLLGITNISIKNNTSFVPTVNIELEDVRGRALFERGEQSPYAAFFTLPYPIFYLTLKGYFGKAIRYPLLLHTFSARFNTSTGNYNISLLFYGYKYNVLADVSTAAALAVPFMYSTEILRSTNNPVLPGSSNSPVIPNQDTNTLSPQRVQRGYEKIKEVYSEYKAKGLIAKDFEELTLETLKSRIKNFEKFIETSFGQQDLTILTDIDNYSSTLNEYRQAVYTGSDSWFSKYMDSSNFFVEKGTGVRIFTFKKDRLESKEEAVSELKKLISYYNNLLSSNRTLGSTGKYQIQGGVEKSSSIAIGIDYSDFEYTMNPSNIDNEATYQQRTGRQGTTETYAALDNILKNNNLFNASEVIVKDGSIENLSFYYKFEGPNTFLDLLSQIGRQLDVNRESIQAELSASLAKKLESRDTGIGFVPTIRNVIAVFMASAEAFLRLMDEVHRKAWDKRLNEDRRATVLENSASAPSVDGKDYTSKAGEQTIPVYPWPQVFVEKQAETGERFELIYPGHPDIINKTKAYLSDVWPEVEFVEEFIKGFAQRQTPIEPSIQDNENISTRVSLNAIEYPIINRPYENKEEVKYFYEIWERSILSSFYNRFNRKSSNTTELFSLISDLESTTIADSLLSSNPFITKKLKELNFNYENYDSYLAHISNQGTGQSFQTYIRGNFVTPYIQNVVNNSFQILGPDYLNSAETSVSKSSTEVDKIRKYLSSTDTNTPNFCDTYPFTSQIWYKTNMARGFALSGRDEIYNTTKTLVYNQTKKVISNYENTDSSETKRPITSFNYLIVKEPNPTGLFNLKAFYDSRKDYNVQLPTEGNLIYRNYSGNVTPEQTMSILNTPYFTNAIQLGVTKWVNDVQYPYKEAAYLFLNSLPLATLREKYKTNSNGVTSDLDYIFATFKKFGAIHKVPYALVLKYGSIWHRYKTFVESGEDILTDVWKDTNYIDNYDPVTSAQTKQYTLTINNKTQNIVLQNDTVNTTTINVGFYPKLINDFHIFYKGGDLLTGFTNSDIQNAINDTLNVNICEQALIIKTPGFDTSKPNRSLIIRPWYSTIKSYKTGNVFLLPSFGGTINQVNDECFKNNQITQEVINNPALHNGSVRSFWTAPTYGYFDNSKVNKPQPSDYLKKILINESLQEAFSIDGVNSYAKIDEMFGVFEKEILDLLEVEFLNFSKSVYDTDFNVGQKPEHVTQPVIDDSINFEFKNFQLLMRNMMETVDVQTTNSQTYISTLQTKQLSSIASKIKTFLQYDVLLKYGNPANYNIKLYYSLSNKFIQDPYVFNTYIPNTLPTNGGVVTLAQSKQLNPNSWKALETYVGFSTIPELTYSNNGSYITDFFPTMNITFNEENVKLLAPLIKIFATQKLVNTGLTGTQFISLVTDYIDSGLDLLKNTFNSTMVKLRPKLPNIQETSEKTITSIMEGNQTKYELYDTFKALNDKWIAGSDYSTRTLFEDVLFLDRASRNIGDKIYVDIFEIKNQLESLGVGKSNILMQIQTILTQNHFVMMNLPSYINFYNVQEPSLVSTPRTEGTSEFANSLFGTFMDVDVRQSSPKLVCFYADRQSSLLDLKDNVDYRFKTDAFDLRRASDSPLLDNLRNKTDWGLSNKVVGFNVDMGIRNQNVFSNIILSQDNGRATSEALQAIDDMANSASGKKLTTQNVSLFNIYKNRSYSCTIQSMGNALIQPMMYFNLRHIPMFHGPYMITDVNHVITPGNFETTFTGVRQSVYSLPKIENFLQNINRNLLQKIIETVRRKKELSQTTAATVNDISVKTSANAKYQNKVPAIPTEACSAKLNPRFVTFTATENSSTKITQSNIAKILKDSVSDVKTRLMTFGIIWMSSYKNNQIFEGNNNNFGDVPLTIGWQAAGDLRQNYICLKQTDGLEVPYATFDTPKDCIDLISAKIANRATLISFNDSTPEIMANIWLKFWPSETMTEKQLTDYINTNKEFYFDVIDKMTQAYTQAKILKIV